MAILHPQRRDAPCTRAGRLRLETTDADVLITDRRQPPLAVRRTALARVGLWPDLPEPESVARWWQAADQAGFAVHQAHPSAPGDSVAT